MKTSIYRLEFFTLFSLFFFLFLSFFCGFFVGFFFSLHWLVLSEKQNILYRVSCSVDMKVIAVGFIFILSPSFSLRSVIETMSN